VTCFGSIVAVSAEYQCSRVIETRTGIVRGAYPVSVNVALYSPAFSRTGKVQGVVQLPPLERSTSAPEGFDTSNTLPESELVIPGIAEHAERAVPHNANITPRILLPAKS